MTDNIRLYDMNADNEEDDDGIEETNVDDDASWNTEWDDDDPHSNEFVVDSVLDIPGELRDREREYEHRGTLFFLRDVLGCPDEYLNPRFIKFLIEKHDFKVIKTIHDIGDLVDVEVEYYGRPTITEDGLLVRNARHYKTEDGELDKYLTATDDIDYLYDKYKSEDNRRRIRAAGLFGGIVVAITSIISGLVLGLKRGGRDMVHNSEMRWKKLTPAEKKKIIIPWTELEKASGKGAIIIGKYFYVILGGLVIVYMMEE